MPIVSLQCLNFNIELIIYYFESCFEIQVYISQSFLLLSSSQHRNWVSGWETLFCRHWTIPAAEFSQRNMLRSCLGAGTRAGNPRSALNEIPEMTSFISAYDSYVTKGCQQRHTRPCVYMAFCFKDWPPCFLEANPLPTSLFSDCFKFWRILCLQSISYNWRKCHIFFNPTPVYLLEKLLYLKLLEHL